ncbi:type I methionyl aminopeptidase [Jatrophihabitans sp.]|uniref:type I methionyl aminopeptidase n=1 Tax=Jatrophihabitans sp. TaxID=1932789 RepID=UPI002C860558|nr:type I methionyl aminopeptidase [Jatrophihabitans sp.]
MRRRRDDIELKTPEQIRSMRAAGLVVAAGLAAMAEAAKPGVSTYELDQIAREVLAEAGAVSSFLGYAGPPPFPGVICSSRNARVVHGIPSPDDVLADGDLLSLDFGAIVDGWHGDAAVTLAVGQAGPDALALSHACRTALWDGIAAARVGGRLTDISFAVQASVEDAGSYGIVAGYGGHGIGTAMHMDPHILNYGKPGKGPRLVAGMALAIEPMITLGSAETRQLADNWTVQTVDGSLAAHWEHTVALLPDGLWVLTAEDGGRAELAARGVPVSALAD